MKVILTEGSRRGKEVDLNDTDAKKLISKGLAKAVSSPKKASKKSKK